MDDRLRPQTKMCDRLVSETLRYRLPELDISANRKARKYSRRETVLRIVWIAGGCLFRWSPRYCFGWRRLVLRWFGARIGAQVHTYPSTKILFPWRLEIGDWSAL